MNSLGFYRNSNEDLCIQGILVGDLAKKYGTPLFVYDSGLMKERYNIFLDTVANVKGNIHYAVKANDALAIISFFTKLGCGADIVSIGEFQKCITAGMSPKKIIPAADSRILEVLKIRNSVSSRNSYGGTAPKNVLKAANEAKQRFLED